MWLTGLVAPWHVGSSQTRARTRVPCIGRQILNHCATREAPAPLLFTCFILFFFLLLYRNTSGLSKLFRIQTILSLVFQWMYLKFYHLYVMKSKGNKYLYSFPENYKTLDNFNSDHTPPNFQKGEIARF